MIFVTGEVFLLLKAALVFFQIDAASCFLTNLLRYTLKNTSFPSARYKEINSSFTVGATFLNVKFLSY